MIYINFTELGEHNEEKKKWILKKEKAKQDLVADFAKTKSGGKEERNREMVK